MKISISLSEDELENIGLTDVDDLVPLLLKGVDDYAGKSVACDVNIRVLHDKTAIRYKVGY